MTFVPGRGRGGRGHDRGRSDRGRGDRGQGDRGRGNRGRGDRYLRINALSILVQHFQPLKAMQSLLIRKNFCCRNNCSWILLSGRSFWDIWRFANSSVW